MVSNDKKTIGVHSKFTITLRDVDVVLSKAEAEQLYKLLKYELNHHEDITNEPKIICNQTQ